MITIKEMLISSIRPLKNKSLSISLLIKPEDILKEDIDKLQDYRSLEIPLVGVFEEFDKQQIEEDKKPKLRQRLAILIKDYCEKYNIKEDDELKRIYSKYGINSRLELTEEQLNDLIEIYNLQLYYNN